MTASGSPETVGVTHMNELKLGDVTITQFFPDLPAVA
jgi:hypothetical protein